MANILDYIHWRGDLTMTERPFNEVDDLILAELSYLDLRGILSVNTESTEAAMLTLSQIQERYAALGKCQDYLINDPAPLLKEAAASARFQNIRAGFYADEIDSSRELQFSALCFFPEDGTLYVSYSGTDNSLVGWREDFNMSYLGETAGQRLSIQYLEEAAIRFPLPIRLGGHSKGGNFALYSASFCSPEVKARILSVSSHDGPGLNIQASDKEIDPEILEKSILNLPESSIIGILLSNKSRRQVIKSTAAGIPQHNPYTWSVQRDSFELADSQSPSSLLMERAVARWIDSLEYAKKRELVSTIFDAMDSTGASTITELNSSQWESYNAILKSLLSLDEERQKSIRQTLKKLAAASSEVIRAEAKEKLKEFLEGARPKTRIDSGL